MLYQVEELYGYRIQAIDREAGRVDDFYFDDARWAVRYLVVTAGSWLDERRFLLTPHVLQEPEWRAGVLPVQLTAEQIRQSPEADLREPLSRQYERKLHGHYGWDYYWLALRSPKLPEEMDVEEGRDPAAGERIRLRRTRTVVGYGVRAQDGDVGRVSDLLLDDEEWYLHYLVVETGGWLDGRQVLLATPWINQVDWTRARLQVDVSRQMIEESPEYDATAPVDREYEEALHDYYARPKYWL